MSSKDNKPPIKRGDSNTSLTLKDFSSTGLKRKPKDDECKSVFLESKTVTSTAGNGSDALSSGTSSGLSSGVSSGVSSGISGTKSKSGVGSAAIEVFGPNDSTEVTMNKWLTLVREWGEGCRIIKREPAPGLGKARNYLRQVKLEQHLRSLCDMAEAVFRKEDRVIKTKSPAVIIGDIHGNLHDLLVLDRSFFSPKSDSFSGHNFVFLGDYIDRGQHSIECILYLMAIKILFPKRFHIVRGNHEVGIVNKQYTFFGECKSKLGVIGETMYYRFNKVFDCIPVYAVVDSSIYCAHGGVPSAPDPSKPVLLSDLEKTPCPLPHPEIGHRLPWEAMWNDPVETEEFDNLIATHRQKMGEKVELTDAMKAGFFPNFKRLTGHFYSPLATRRFLKANKLSVVVRAHEHCQEGVTLKQNGMCYTVFTTSKYATENSAGIIIIEKGRIRPQKINTDIYPK